MVNSFPNDSIFPMLRRSLEGVRLIARRRPGTGRMRKSTETAASGIQPAHREKASMKIVPEDSTLPIESRSPAKGLFLNRFDHVCLVQFYLTFQTLGSPCWRSVLCQFRMRSTKWTCTAVETVGNTFRATWVIQRFVHQEWGSLVSASNDDQFE